MNSSNDDIVSAGSMGFMCCFITGGVIAVGFVALGVVCFVVGAFCAMFVPTILAPARSYDDHFHGALCEYTSAQVVGSKLYPEFRMFRRGRDWGLGAIFRHCDDGKKCTRNGDGEKRCITKLKYVECSNYTAPPFQMAGSVPWVDPDFTYVVGTNYSCTMTTRTLKRVRNSPGCSSWPNGVGCVMKDRSDVANSASDEVYEGLMWGFVWGPLSAAAGFFVLAVVVMIIFALLGGAVFLCAFGVFAAIWTVEKTQEGAAQAKETADDYWKETAQTDQSLPPATDDGELDVVDDDVLV